MSSPVIFLDFDGVIRVPVEGQWPAPDQAEFCQERMRLLGDACLQTGAKIVVSSDWRNFENLPEIQQLLAPFLTGHLHEDWATPVVGHRWNEVTKWLSAHPDVSRYVILEDFAPHFDGCPPVMQSRLLLCTSRYGLVPRIIARLLEIFSTEN